MTKQEYRTIRDIAWLILINSKSSSLPINVNKIANLYSFADVVNTDKTRYENCLAVCREIIKLYGMNSNLSYHLTIRIMAPAIVLREIKVASAKELSIIADVPMDVAERRFSRLQELLKRDKFETSNMESIVLSQFKSWIENHNAQNNQL